MIPAGMRDFEACAARAYAEGRREQRCPDCGREEVGGSYCTACSRPMHPDDWTSDTATGRAAQARGRAMVGRRATKSATAAKPEKGYPTTTTATAAA